MAAETDRTAEIVQAINEFYLQADQLYHNAAKRMGLADCAFEILYNLMEQDGLTQKQLCDAGFSSKQTISSSVRRLQEDGLVELRAQDGPSTRVFLTKQGRQLVDRKMRQVFQAECAAASIFPPSRQREVAENIRLYTAALSRHLGAMDL